MRRYDYTDMQVIRTVTGGSQTLNAGEAEIYGLDAELAALPTDRVTLAMGLSVVHARYTEFPGAPATMPNPAGGNSPVPGGVDASGNRAVRSPDWTANLKANYDLPVTSGKVSFNISYFYNDGFFWEAENRALQDAYHLLNTQVRWSSIDDRWAVRLWGRNLLGEEYYSHVSSSSGDIGSAAPPMTYGISLETNF